MNDHIRSDVIRYLLSPCCKLVSQKCVSKTIPDKLTISIAKLLLNLADIAKLLHFILPALPNYCTLSCRHW